MSIESKIKELNIIIPDAPSPVGSYVASKTIGNLLFISGQISLDKDNNLITGLIPKEIESLVKTKVLSGGMLPKIQAALIAAENKVNSVHIIDGRVEHALLLEILTDQGVGTLIKAN